MKCFTEADFRKLLEEAHEKGAMRGLAYDTAGPGYLKKLWYLEQRKEDIDRMMAKV